jgi:hypothetical protein
MMTRRTVIVVLGLVLLATILTAVVQVAGGPAAAPRAVAPRPAQPAAPAGVARHAVRSLDAVERAFDAGNVGRLCRPGALVDPAVIRRQDAGSGDCAIELEALIGSHAPLRLAVRKVSARPDLATLTVATANGTVAVDVVRQDDRWLLSFSAGGDPMPALAGVA